MAKKKSKSKATIPQPQTDEEPESEEEPHRKPAAKAKGHSATLHSDGASPQEDDNRVR